MKKLSLLSFAAMLLAFSFSAQAQQASDTGEATVTVEFHEITLHNETTLNFGTLLPFGRTGTIRVTPAGATVAFRTLSIAPGAAAEWTVTGTPSAPYAIALPVNIELIDEGGLNNMLVNSFTTSVTDFANRNNAVLDAAGDGSFTVGATLNVGANQPLGVYSGQYEVTVSYN